MVYKMTDIRQYPQTSVELTLLHRQKIFRQAQPEDTEIKNDSCLNTEIYIVAFKDTS